MTGPAAPGLQRIAAFTLTTGDLDATVAAYQRSDLFEKRRNLMADWAAFLNTEPVVGDNVVQIRGAA